MGHECLKRQNCQWKSPTLSRPKKARQSQKSNSFWSNSSMWGISFSMSSGHRAKQATSKATKRSSDVRFVQRAKWLELLLDKLWLLHCDNFWSFWQFLAERHITILEQLVFHHVSGIIKETRFEGIKAINRAAMTELSGIPEEFLQQCLEAWQTSNRNDIKFEEAYFEGGMM